MSFPLKSRNGVLVALQNAYYFRQCLRLKKNSCMCTAIDLWKSNDTLSTSTTSTTTVNGLLNYLATYRARDPPNLRKGEVTVSLSVFTAYEMT